MMRGCPSCKLVPNQAVILILSLSHRLVQPDREFPFVIQQ